MSSQSHDTETKRALPRDPERVESRAGHLLPEERVAGSVDPRAQAAAILAESDAREHDPEPAFDPFPERPMPEQAVPTVDELMPEGDHAVSPGEHAVPPPEPPD